MEMNLISKQKGFLRRITAVGKDEVTMAKQYYIHVYWETMADAMKAAEVVSADPGGKVLFQYTKNPNGIDHYAHYEIGDATDRRKNAGVEYPGLTDPKVTDPNVALEVVALNMADGVDLNALKTADHQLSVAVCDPPLLDLPPHALIQGQRESSLGCCRDAADAGV